MIKKLFIIIISFIFVHEAYSQMFSPPDSINVLNEIHIQAKRELSATGTKVIKLDSIILENKTVDNLSELISENSSIFVKSYGRGSMSTASFRGTNASHTKVSWNNISLNSPILGMVDLSQIPMLITDDVTIYHGAASLSRSNNALGGLIELNTKTDWKKGIRAKFVSSVGSFSTYDNMLEVKLGDNKIQSVSKVYYNYSKNDFTFINNDIINGGKERRQNADYEKKGFEQEIFYRINSHNILSLKAWIQDSGRGVPGLTTNQSGVNNNINRESYQMLVYSVEYLNIKEKFRFELQHGGNYQKSNYNNKNYIRGQGYLEKINSDGKSFSIYNSSSFKYTINKNNEISLKMDYNLHKVNYMEEIRNEGYDTVRHEGGITASWHSNIFNNLKLGILFKQNFYDNKFTPFIPSLFTEYLITENLWAKMSIARNYNIPGMNDLYFVPGGNPNLKPEEGFCVDGGLQSSFSKKNWILQSEISLNYSNIKNWILWRPTAMGYWTPNNISKVTAYGADINIIFKLNISKISLTSNINYAYTRSENRSEPLGDNDKSIGKQLPYIPVHSGNIFIKAEYRNFYISYQWNYFSERFTTSAAEPGILTSLYPYFMNNLGLGKKIIYKDFAFNISFSINNLFNESYRSVLWQPMPGINYSLQLNIKFR